MLKLEPRPEFHTSIDLIKRLSRFLPDVNIKIHTGKNVNSALWARATKNVEKPQNQMCELCRKA